MFLLSCQCGTTTSQHCVQGIQMKKPLTLLSSAVTLPDGSSAVQ